MSVYGQNSYSCFLHFPPQNCDSVGLGSVIAYSYANLLILTFLRNIPQSLVNCTEFLQILFPSQATWKNRTVGKNRTM